MSRSRSRRRCEAAREGSPGAAEVLIARGAPIDAIDREHGSTPLGWAAYFGHVALATIPIISLWHERSHLDPAKKWIRGTIARAFALGASRRRPVEPRASAEAAPVARRPARGRRQ